MPEPVPTLDRGPAATDEDAVPDPGAIDRALRSVIDPELGVNVVDLGLVYGAEARDGTVTITLTTTTPACPIGGFLEDQVRRAVWRVDGVDEVEVHVVHEPRWTPDRISDAARQLLGIGR